ncbi:MAG: hypothetical protein KJ811_04370 [Candidatus Margulisbacteria bacterium]|nr:hypothetical protein [Candidatus Margulisiibacteriota bacterium]
MGIASNFRIIRQRFSPLFRAYRFGPVGQNLPYLVSTSSTRDLKEIQKTVMANSEGAGVRLVNPVLFVSNTHLPFPGLKENPFCQFTAITKGLLQREINYQHGLPTLTRRETTTDGFPIPQPCKSPNNSVAYSFSGQEITSFLGKGEIFSGSAGRIIVINLDRIESENDFINTALHLTELLKEPLNTLSIPDPLKN